MRNELVVISANGAEHAEACVASWEKRAPFALLDTGSGDVRGARDNVGPVWQTGAFLHAYREFTDVDAFLFTQDTVTVLPDWPDDPLDWFHERFPRNGGIGAVGWQLFPMAWDSDAQRSYVEGWYADDIKHSRRRPDRGIVGPVFYTTRETLDVLSEYDLLPPIPTTREQQAGTERAWAYAFALAGIELAGEPFVPNEVPARVTEYGPLRKVWMH